jgi:hypothetical protein
MLADRYWAEHLRASSDCGAFVNLRPGDDTFFQTDRHEGSNANAAVYLGEAVDHNVTVGKDDAGMNEHRVADRELCPRDREAVRDAWDDRYPPPLASGSNAVEHQRAERVGHEDQVEQLEEHRHPSRQLPLITALAARQREVRENCFFQPRVTFLDGAQ